MKMLQTNWLGCAICTAVVSICIFSTFAYGNVITGPFVAGTGHWQTLTNGGFETGSTSGWYGSGWKGSFSASSTMAFTGSYSVESRPSYSFNGPGFALNHNVSVQSGVSYVLSGFFNTASLTEGDQMYIDLNDVSFEHSCVAPTGVAGWQFVWWSFTVPSGYHSLTVRLVRDGNVVQGHYGYVDEVALTPVSEFATPEVVPEPATLLLLAMGGLSVFRRRR